MHVNVVVPVTKYTFEHPGVTEHWYWQRHRNTLCANVDLEPFTWNTMNAGFNAFAYLMPLLPVELKSMLALGAMQTRVVVGPVYAEVVVDR